jgi:hypothetical protein
MPIDQPAPAADETNGPAGLATTIGNHAPIEVSTRESATY